MIVVVSHHRIVAVGAVHHVLLRLVVGGAFATV